MTDQAAMHNTKGAELSFNGTWEADAIRLINPGGWYIGVKSPGTGKVYAILPEPTGTGRLRLSGDASLAITNPDTNAVEHFTASDLVVFQAATALPQEPVEPR